MSRIFGAVRQIAYVVPDLLATVRYLSDDMGIGPWFVGQDVKAEDCFYRGRPIELTMSVAFANSGDLQVEVIQQTSSQSSMQTEWLNRNPKGRGIHHLSSWPTDYQSTYDAALSAGFTVIQQGTSRNGPYAFFEKTTHPDMIFEIAELSDRRRSVYEQVAAAAREWAGADPVRFGWPAPIL